MLHPGYKMWMNIFIQFFYLAPTLCGKQSDTAEWVTAEPADSITLQVNKAKWNKTHINTPNCVQV